MRFFRIIQSKKLYIIVIILFAIFLLAGGFSALDAYLNGASSYEQYVNATLAPLFGGCLFVGSFGLLYAYKHKDSAVCLLGFFITFFCYAFIEYLFQTAGVI
jgi:hypothetical protein